MRVLTFPASPDRISWLLLPAAFLLGGIAGHLFAGVRSGQLTEVLTAYGTGILSSEFGLREVGYLLWQVVRMLLLAFVLSFSALGVAGLPILLSVQGFMNAYAVSAIVRTWGYHGFAVAVLWVGIGDLIQLVMLLTVAIPGWGCAWELASGGRAGRALPKNYLRSCTGICLAGTVLSVFYRWIVYTFLAPLLWAGL